jgi:endonuclease/exonuclease/phosphatase family metal-dependent hydrolase
VRLNRRISSVSARLAGSKGRRSRDLAYIRRSYKAAVWPSPVQKDPSIELLWVKVARDYDVTFVGALYHPLAPLYASTDLLDVIESAVFSLLDEFPDAHIIPAGDLNMLAETEIVTRTGVSSIVFHPNRGNNRLDRIYVSDQLYSSVKVIKSTVESDHPAIVADAPGVIPSVSKTSRVCTFTKRAHICSACHIPG